ncbi:MAG: exodeoxyribonuclease VII small subunit [Clostridia bacterium]|nr:exodeoxyribonuclease VII small subunit [Clostridia bacterium]
MEQLSNKLSFEERLTALEALVAELRGDIPLAQALDLYEKGVRHAGECQKQLQQAEQRVTALNTETGEITCCNA